MTIKIYQSKEISATYFGETTITGQFRSVSTTRVTLFTKDYGLMVFPFTDIEYIEDSDTMNIIAVLSQMKDFNTTGKVSIEIHENIGG